MITFKGFQPDMSALYRSDETVYEVGKTYTVEAADCASRGFHSVNEPLQVLEWSRAESTRYVVCEAGGDIHEDGTNRVSSTELTLLKEVSLKELAMIEAKWIEKHPLRENTRFVNQEFGQAQNGICFVRGKNPKGRGAKGDLIILAEEQKTSKKIKNVYVFHATKRGLYGTQGMEKEDAKRRTKKTPEPSADKGNGRKGKGQ